MFKKVKDFLIGNKANELAFSTPKKSSDTFFSKEDVDHHCTYFSTAYNSEVGVNTPSPIEVVLELSRFGIDHFDYLKQFGPSSCHYSKIQEFLTFCPTSSDLIKIQ